MSEVPIVSIVMPAFNSASFIEASIDSVVKQEFRDWELLVVDGGSIDETLDIVIRYSAIDSRIRLILNPDDHGPAHARSTGIKHARGEYIAFLDADDLWLSKKLSNQMEFMQRTNTVFSYTQYRQINSQGTEALCPVRIHKQYNFTSYLFLRGIGCSTVIAQRDLFTEDVLSTYGSSHGEDTLWWLKLLRAGANARGLLEPLVLYRNTEGSRSKDRYLNQISVWRIYRNDFHLSAIVAAIAYVSYLGDVAMRRAHCRLCTRVFGKKRLSELGL